MTDTVRSADDDARRRAALLTILAAPNVIPDSVRIRFGWDREDDRQRPLIATYDVTTPSGIVTCFRTFDSNDPPDTPYVCTTR